MQGGAWQSGSLALTDKVSTTMPAVHLTWKLATQQDKDNARDRVNWVDVPVYLNASRLQTLFSVRLRCPTGITADVWAQRGISLAVWHASA